MDETKNISVIVNILFLLAAVFVGVAASVLTALGESLFYGIGLTFVGLYAIFKELTQAPYSKKIKNMLVMETTAIYSISLGIAWDFAPKLKFLALS